MGHVHAELVLLVLAEHQHLAPALRILHDEVLDRGDRDAAVEVQAELAETLAVLGVPCPEVGDLVPVFADSDHFVQALLALDALQVPVVLVLVEHVCLVDLGQGEVLVLPEPAGALDALLALLFVPVDVVYIADEIPFHFPTVLFTGFLKAFFRSGEEKLGVGPDLFFAA